MKNGTCHNRVRGFTCAVSENMHVLTESVLV